MDLIASNGDEPEVTDAEEAVQAVLSRLNEQDAQIILMRFFEGHTLAGSAKKWVFPGNGFVGWRPGRYATCEVGCR